MNPLPSCGASASLAYRICCRSSVTLSPVRAISFKSTGSLEMAEEEAAQKLRLVQQNSPEVTDLDINVNEGDHIAS